MAREEIRSSGLGGAFQSVRFVFHGYTAFQMQQIGNGFLQNGMLPRIRRGANIYDQPAKPLSEKVRLLKGGRVKVTGYAELKRRKGLKPIRDWVFSGDLMRETRVITSRDNYAVLGASNPKINAKIFYNNRRERQFGVSPSDRPALSKEFAAQPAHTRAEVVK